MTESSPRASDRQATIALLSIAAVMALLHIITNVRYGFHRDELQFLADARHLDWGFVVNPPVTPLIGRLALILFGLSLVKIRLFAVLAQAIAIVLTGLMAREFGGGRLSQILAGLLIALAPISIHCGTQFFYSSFDYLWWILAAYCLAHLLRTQDPRWWLAVGLAFGVGLETKYTILTFILGLIVGIVFTPMRSALRSGWFWGGVGIATLLILPNAVWQINHQFISARCLHAIHVRDLGLGRDKSFFWDQLIYDVNFWATPIWVVGLVASFRNPDRRYRLFGFAYLVPLVIYVATRARGYYLAPAYPMLLAMGAVRVEPWFASLSRLRRRLLASVFLTALLAHGTLFFLKLTPWATGGKLQQWVLAGNWDLREEFGWEELVGLTAKIRDELPREHRHHCC
jgi:4-amino-4-deoxy-L-arabinose transferase-like glycosyltransferase